MAKTRVKNPTIQYVDIELQGQTYHLAFDYNAIAVAEEHAGVNMLQAFSFSNLNARQFRAMFWATLLPAQPDITLEQAGALITMDRIKSITDAVVEAWAASLPKENPQKPEPKA